MTTSRKGTSVCAVCGSVASARDAVLRYLDVDELQPIVTAKQSGTEIVNNDANSNGRRHTEVIKFGRIRHQATADDVFDRVVSTESPTLVLAACGNRPCTIFAASYMSVLPQDEEGSKKILIEYPSLSELSIPSKNLILVGVIASTANDAEWNVSMTDVAEVCLRKLALSQFNGCGVAIIHEQPSPSRATVSALQALYLQSYEDSTDEPVSLQGDYIRELRARCFFANPGWDSAGKIKAVEDALRMREGTMNCHFQAISRESPEPCGEALRTVLRSFGGESSTSTSGKEPCANEENNHTSQPHAPPPVRDIELRPEDDEFQWHGIPYRWNTHDESTIQSPRDVETEWVSRVAQLLTAQGDQNHANNELGATATPYKSKVSRISSPAESVSDPQLAPSLAASGSHTPRRSAAEETAVPTTSATTPSTKAPVSGATFFQRFLSKGS